MFKKNAAFILYIMYTYKTHNIFSQTLSFVNIYIRSRGCTLTGNARLIKTIKHSDFEYVNGTVFFL